MKQINGVVIAGIVLVGIIQPVVPVVEAEDLASSVNSAADISRFTGSMDRFLQSLNIENLTVEELNNAASGIQKKLSDIILSEEIEAPEEMALQLVTEWCQSYDALVRSQQAMSYINNNSAIAAWLKKIDCEKVSKFLVVEPMRLKRFLMQELVRVMENGGKMNLHSHSR
ncbi:MAG: hypothetical protein PHC51_14190 [bacterium]|nr:hypothetical protein [bacterium]